MKIAAIIFLSFLMMQTSALADVHTFNEDGRFGLKTENGDIIVNAEYKKLVRLGNSAWIMQDGSHFGIIDDNGKIIEAAKYVQAERVLGKFVKFKRGEKYGIYDEKGFELLPIEYSSIDLLPGGMFVTCKNFKYGVTDLNGQLILDNIFDDIYMEGPNKLTVVYLGHVYNVVREKGEAFDMMSVHREMDFVVTEETFNPIIATGYYSITVTDYLLKIFSSISPAYEKTIDELMYSQGADTVNILMKFEWLPKFPVVYAKKYYTTFIDPTNGPLRKIKTNLKNIE